jgi:plasmid stability protein
MTTSLNLPDELVAQLRQRAARDGKNLDELAAGLLAAALGSAAVTVGELVSKNLPLVKARPVISENPQQAVVSTDPVTGLPVIESPPDAPIRSMTNEQILELIEQTQLEEDLERAGIALRH